MAWKFLSESHLSVFSFQLSISAEDTTCIIQSISTSLRYGSTNYCYLQSTRNFRQHGRWRRCITTRIDVLSISREAIIWIWTIPYFLTWNFTIILSNHNINSAFFANINSQNLCQVKMVNFFFFYALKHDAAYFDLD